MLIVTHIIAALSGLILGVAALCFPNGTRVHRAVGKGYLLAWLGIGVTGFAIGADTPGLSAFEILLMIGLLLVALGFGTMRLRKRIGRKWLGYHYRFMAASLAALVVAGTNQTLTQTVGNYPRWIFWALVFSPFLILPKLHRRFDARFGVVRSPKVAAPEVDGRSGA